MKKYVAEPFKIKMVEPIRMTTREEREQKLKEANYNVFALKSDDVYIDFMTDSGTGALSDDQWAGMMKGDESYAGARGYFKVEKAIQDIIGYEFVQPVHQGRAAEQVLFPNLLKKGQYCISNMHFDTTRGHVDLLGAKPVDVVVEEAKDTVSFAPFKGNMDLERMEKFIQEVGKENIGLIIMTITNNSAGGQPVSMKNIKETRAMADKYGIKMIID
ncbi:MAG: tryptophanase, partial [Clostridia bacterium]|nr:tryptophanase [Clostridia bacterium]